MPPFLSGIREEIIRHMISIHKYTYHAGGFSDAITGCPGRPAAQTSGEQDSRAGLAFDNYVFNFMDCLEEGIKSSEQV
jgi:hypothetical protein